MSFDQLKKKKWWQTRAEEGPKKLLRQDQYYNIFEERFVTLSAEDIHQRHIREHEQQLREERYQAELLRREEEAAALREQQMINFWRGREHYGDQMYVDTVVPIQTYAREWYFGEPVVTKPARKTSKIPWL